MKIWEFTGETKTFLGITLRRIRSIQAIPKYDVSIGDVGGWIEKEDNLSGNAWVSGNAQVYGDACVSGGAQVYGGARVYGDACVYGNARVYGDACVYGNAQVYGDACVYGNAKVYGNAQVYDGARVYGDACVYGGAWVASPLFINGTRWSLCMATNTILKIGCEKHTLKHWQSNYKQIAEKHGALNIAEEYKLYIELFCARYLKDKKEDK